MCASMKVLWFAQTRATATATATTPPEFARATTAGGQPATSPSTSPRIAPKECVACIARHPLVHAHACRHERVRRSSLVSEAQLIPATTNLWRIGRYALRDQPGVPCPPEPRLVITSPSAPIGGTAIALLASVSVKTATQASTPTHTHTHKHTHTHLHTASRRIASRRVAQARQCFFCRGQT